jgi:alkylhydroperoxidase family enzyme
MTQPAQRMPSVTRDEWTDEVRDVFAVYEGKQGWENGSKWNFTHWFANHPPLAQAWLNYNRVLTTGSMPPVLREIIVLRVSHNCNSEYEWHMHTEIARHHMGMGADYIEAIRQGPDSPFWPELERNCLRAVDQLCAKQDIDDEIWATLSRKFDRRLMMELMFLVGSYSLLACVLRTVRLPLEGTPARLNNAG